MIEKASPGGFGQGFAVDFFSPRWRFNAGRQRSRGWLNSVATRRGTLPWVAGPLNAGLSKRASQSGPLKAMGISVRDTSFS